MKKMVIAGVIFLASVATQAQSRSYSAYGDSHSLTALLGFSSTALNIGVNYENRSSGNVGVGGYFLMGSEKKDAGIPQVTSFGGILPIHFVDDSRVNLSLAPGFGVHMIKGLGGNDEDVTTFGPIWKLGAMFKISSNMKVGAEHTTLANWFSDKKGSEYRSTNAAFNFSF